MPIIETKWGTIKPESTKDMQEIIDILNRKNEIGRQFFGN